MKTPLPLQYNREHELNGLSQVARCAQSSRMVRMLNMPLKYIRLWKTRLGKASTHSGHLFFGPSFHLALPAAADVYLCGGKTHDSELRLARFLIRYLPVDAHVLDIGAHFGYFTLLMAHLAQYGRVFGIEAAPTSMAYLKRNTESNSHIRTFAMALGESKGSMPFYTFPARYSEYNTLDIRPYQEQDWFKVNPPEVHSISVDTLDGFCSQHGLNVTWIKMDVEGAEDRVLQGASNMLNTKAIWMMEYLAQGNTASYESAEKRFLAAGYASFAINENGDLFPVNGILNWMRTNGCESENVVFLKG